MFLYSFTLCVTDLLHEDEHRFSVLLPLVRQLALMRELITAQEYGQLKTVGVQVAEIIHTWGDIHTHTRTSKPALLILSTRVCYNDMQTLKSPI